MQEQSVRAPTLSWLCDLIRQRMDAIVMLPNIGCGKSKQRIQTVQAFVSPLLVRATSIWCQTQVRAATRNALSVSCIVGKSINVRVALGST